ncbi:DNA-binding protein WhiA [Mycoplasmoides genitalium]
MTFSTQIKAELVQNKLIDKHWNVFLAGFFQNNLKLLYNRNWSFKVQSEALKEQFVKNLKFDFKTKASKKYFLFEFNADINVINTLLKLDVTTSELVVKQVYLIAAFLSGGSVSNLINSNNFHLQISSNNEFQIQQLLKLFNFFKKTVKQNQLVVYLKSYEKICNFLKLIQAFDGYLAFENKQLEKSFTLNQLRKSNLEVANLMKTIRSNNQTNQLQLKSFIKSSSFAKRPLNFQRYCLIKSDHPDWSLEQIANFFFTKYNIKISRSGIQHFSVNLKKLCQ